MTMMMMIRLPYDRIHIMRSMMIRGSIFAIDIVAAADDNNNNNNMVLLLMFLMTKTITITMTMIHFTTPKFTIDPQ